MKRRNKISGQWAPLSVEPMNSPHLANLNPEQRRAVEHGEPCADARLLAAALEGIKAGTMSSNKRSLPQQQGG